MPLATSDPFLDNANHSNILLISAHKHCQSLLLNAYPNTANHTLMLPITIYYLDIASDISVLQIPTQTQLLLPNQTQLHVYATNPLSGTANHLSILQISTQALSITLSYVKITNHTFMLRVSTHTLSVAFLFYQSLP